MKTTSKRIETILCEAIEIACAADRQAYLDNVCGHDAELRREAEILIANHFEAGHFLEEPVTVAHAANQGESPVVLDNLDHEHWNRESAPVEENGAPAPAEGNILTEPMSSDAIGTGIGNYKLLQKIGEGGMGIVYMAEQTKPVTRRVALKVIKPGMDSKEVLARFEAERQALALMSHPNIAGVLDAGTTATGRPYFVMELVRGIPITKYCDDNHLTPEERIRLFVPICQAVQHAHQKGVIHRDIKPSNILVAEYDNRPVPKIIDFGVAKAVGQKLTQRTMFTQYGQIVGTIEYMSPEQASFSQLDVDTRTDIYSMGVLLYELLTGQTPFDRKRLRSAAFDELLRIIRQEEPPRPSVRLSSHADLPRIAANRKTEPKRLNLLVRGDLDWIVMKAMDKERNRRYQSATGFAEDISRHLEHELVQACPPSTGYRFRKFARRNRGLLASAATVLAVLVLGLVGTSWGLVRAIAAEEQALAAKDQESNARRVAEIEAKRAHKNATVLGFNVQIHIGFQESTLASLNRWTAQIGRDPQLKKPNLRPLREQMLREVAQFWKEAADAQVDQSGNPNLRSREFLLERALCLARLGDHEPAFHAMQELRLDTGRIDPRVRDLIRICALCASATEDQDLTDTYVEAGVDILKEAADVSVFPPPASDDPDFVALKSQEDYQRLYEQWLQKWSRREGARANR